MFVIIFTKTMYNETITRFSFCDILNNQGLDKCYQPWPSARLITLISTLSIPDITRTSSNNNCVLFSWIALNFFTIFFKQPLCCLSESKFKHIFCLVKLKIWFTTKLEHSWKDWEQMRANARPVKPGLC